MNLATTNELTKNKQPWLAALYINLEDETY